MSSLSQEMKNKRDIKRRSSVLIVDSDLGNIGLYKSILAMEYDLECGNNTALALNMCQGKKYDMVIADGALGTEEIVDFFRKVKAIDDRSDVLFLVIAEPTDREQIVSCMCHGASGYIPKPFTKEGMSGTIYSALKDKRESQIRHKVLIIDEDTNTLKTMKEYLKDKYAVYIMNSCDNVPEFIKCNRPELIIANIKMPERAGMDMCIRMKELQDITGMRMLFMTDEPDTEVIARCAQFRPEGFMVKPIDKDTLVNTLENIFLRESYMNPIAYM